MCEVKNTNSTNSGRVILFKVYGKYERLFTYVRSNAFLVGILHYAMLEEQDITCMSPVSETLLYNGGYLLLSLEKNHAFEESYQYFKKNRISDSLACFLFNYKEI